MESREVPDIKNMNKDEYRAAYEGRVWADRMALNLPIIPDELKGDMDEVSNLRDALKKIRDIDYRGNKHESHYIARTALEKPDSPAERSNIQAEPPPVSGGEAQGKLSNGL